VRSDTEQGTSIRMFILIGVLAVLALIGALYIFFSMSGGADVSGRVTLDGDPVKGALVIFTGADGKNPSPLTAQTDDDGNYRLQGNQGGRVPVGKYKATVTKQALPSGKVPTGEKLEQARAKELLVNVLPKAYEDAASTPLLYDFASGKNTINLELKKKASGKGN